MDIPNGLVGVDKIAGDGLQQNQILKLCYRVCDMNTVFGKKAKIEFIINDCLFTLQHF